MVVLAEEGCREEGMMDHTCATLSTSIGRVEGSSDPGVRIIGSSRALVYVPALGMVMWYGEARERWFCYESEEDCLMGMR